MMLSLFVVCACWSVAAGVLEVPRCCPDGANLAYNAVGADLLRDVAEAACQPLAEPAAVPWAPRIYQPAKATWMERGQIPPRWRLVGPRVPSCEPLRPLHDVAYTLLAHNGSMHVTGMTRVLPLTRYCIDETAALVCSDDLPRVVNKCCPEKQAYFEGQCVDSEYGPKAMEDLKVVASAAGLGVSVAWPTTCSHFSDVGAMEGAVPQPDGSVTLTNGRVEAGRWCAEAAAEGVVSILACTTAAQHAEPPAQHLLYGVGLAVGAAFLAATLAASFTLPPSHRALHWRCQTHYVATLFLGDVLLAATQLAGSEVPPGLCKALAVCMHFLFLAAFFWLNTMCFNIWWTFRDFRPTSLERTQEAWRLRVYQVYAWGGPLLLAGTAAVLDVLASDSVLRPRFGERSCWFYGDSEILVYFFGPVGVLLLVNVALFLSTAHQLTCGLWRHDEVKSTSERAALGRVCTKLVVVMGVTWGADVLSWAVGGPNYLWYATDLVNALQGVLIFLVVGWHAHTRAALCRLWMKVKRAGGEGGPEAAALDERARGTHSSTQQHSCGESLTNTTSAPPPAPAPDVQPSPPVTKIPMETVC